jgi:hypothetical protein
MENISIPIADFKMVEKFITISKKHPEFAVLLQDDDFLEKLSMLVKHFSSKLEDKLPENPLRATMKRGSGKHLIRNISDDFDALLDDFKEYM